MFYKLAFFQANSCEFSVPTSAGRGIKKSVQDEFKKYREIAPPTLSDDALTELIKSKKYANLISKSLQEMWHGK